jgi:uncharacterized protein YbjT (DUF2867 family)
VLARLRAEAHDVVAVTRSLGPASQRLPASRFIVIDIARATRAEDWIPHLDGIDAVVNCAGVFQDSPSESTKGVHVEGIGALFAACERAGVRRIVHISAIGIDREAPTAFSRTKLEGDKTLMARDLDWVILRPSVVVGRAAYGGSALIRGLAALPVVPVFPEAGPLQIVQLDDLTRTISFFVRPGAPARVALDVAGRERLAFTDVVLAFRRWLGWDGARLARVPDWLAAAMYRLGDAAAWLGWPTPMRSNARQEIRRGAVGDPSKWSRITGIEPQSLSAALAAAPASVQDRWFANLYFLKPLVFGILALFWIGTGLISLGPGWDIGMSYMRAGGAAAMGPLAIVAGALADIVLGIGLLIRRTARLAIYGMLAISLSYVVIGTILVPDLWRDPLGPMLKIWPVMVLVLVALAILEDR